jgi:biotin operon repressor
MYADNTMAKRKRTKDILYILQATVKLSLKIEESESIEAKKKIEKLRKDGVHITSDEQTTCMQTTQWPKEKGQKDKQRSTKHYT